MLKLRRTVLSAFLLALSASMAAAMQEAEDHHLQDEGMSALVRKSAFVHGYLHGYEQGFRAGDTDLQMGRPARDPERARDYRRSGGDYQAQFGNRADFRRGYHEGFVVGYSDSYERRPFRAVAEARALADSLSSSDAASSVPEAPTRPSRTFDSGFASGYTQGRDVGLGDVRVGRPYRPEPPGCAAPEVSRHLSPEFCEGMRRGFILGYSDGYANQRLPVESMHTTVAGGPD